MDDSSITQKLLAETIPAARKGGSREPPREMFT